MSLLSHRYQNNFLSPLSLDPPPPSPPSLVLRIARPSVFLFFLLTFLSHYPTAWSNQSAICEWSCHLTLLASIILSLLTIRLKLCLKPLVIPVLFNSPTNYPSTTIQPYMQLSYSISAVQMLFVSNRYLFYSSLFYKMELARQHMWIWFHVFTWIHKLPLHYTYLIEKATQWFMPLMSRYGLVILLMDAYR